MGYRANQIVVLSKCGIEYGKKRGLQPNTEYKTIEKPREVKALRGVCVLNDDGKMIRLPESFICGKWVKTYKVVRGKQ